MIDLYKRYVFWQLRVMGKVPGLKRYSAWLTRHYTKNFWRTTGIIVGISALVNFVVQLYLNLTFRELEKRYTNEFVSTLPSTDEYEDKPQFKCATCHKPYHYPTLMCYDCCIDAGMCVTVGCSRLALKGSEHCSTCQTNIAATLNNPT